jgi:hypothetical protein
MYTPAWTREGCILDDVIVIGLERTRPSGESERIASMRTSTDLFGFMFGVRSGEPDSVAS